MNLIDKDTLIAELKKRIQDHLNAGGATPGLYLSGRMKEDAYILSFIDTIYVFSEPSLPSNLDEAAETYEYEKGHLYHPSIKEIFIAGAKWQKSQMLKDAVGAEVQYFGETQGVPRTIKIPRMQEWLKPFKHGDKLRILALKAEEE